MKIKAKVTSIMRGTPNDAGTRTIIDVMATADGNAAWGGVTPTATLTIHSMVSGADAEFAEGDIVEIDVTVKPA